MKKIIFLLTFIVLSNAPIAVGASSLNELRKVEERLATYLNKYLDPYDYMVVVVPNKDIKGKENVEGVESLPGVPGLNEEAEGQVEYKSYFDVDGKLASSIPRPPISVQVVFSRRVSGESIRSFRKMLPYMANINSEYGDEIKVTVANLERPQSFQEMPVNAQAQHTLDVIMKYKSEMIWASGVFLLTLFLFLLVHEVMAYIKVRTSSGTLNASRPAATPSGAAAIASPSSGVEGADKNAPKNQLPNLAELYSKDRVLHSRIQEVIAQAKQHPHRLAKLLTQWLQAGDVGIRSAAILLHNLDMTTTDVILEKMIASDLDYLQAYMDLEFDAFSEENARVIMQARQDLMKIVAQTSGKESHEHLGFIQSMEQDVLLEMLADESPKTIAYVSRALPAHRLTEVINRLDERKQQDFITEVCNFGMISDVEIAEMNRRLLDKASMFKKIVFTESDKTRTFINIVKNLKTEQARRDFLEGIRSQSLEIQQQVRSSIFLFEDVLRLSDRALKILVAEEDAVIVARAFSREQIEAKQRVRSVLSKTNLEIFEYELSRQSIFPNKEYEEARVSLVSRLSVLVYDKVIARTELHLEEVVSQDAELIADKNNKESA